MSRTVTCGAWFLILVALSLASVWAQAPNPSAGASVTGEEARRLDTRREAVQAEQARVARERSDLDAHRQETARRLKALSPGEISSAMVDRAELNAGAERVNLEGIELELQSTRQQVDSLAAAIAMLKQRIEELEKAPSDQTKPQEGILKQQEALALKQRALEIEGQHLANLQAARDIASQRLALALQWSQEQRGQYKMARELSDKAALSDLQARLQKEQQALLDQAAELRAHLEAMQANGAERAALETRLQEAEELARIKQTGLALAQAQAKLNGLEIVLSNMAATTEELATALGQAQSLLQDLDARARYVQGKITLLNEQHAVIVKRLSMDRPKQAQAITDSRSIQKLLGNLENQAKQVAFLREMVEKRHAALQARYKQALRQSLLARHNLPSDVAGWRMLGRQLLSLPAALWQGVYIPITTAARRTSLEDLLVILVVELVWLGLIFWARRHLSAPNSSSAQAGFLVNLLHATTRLLRASSISLAVSGALLLLLAVARLPQPGSGILAVFVSAWLVYKVTIDLTQLLLLDGRYTQGQTHPRLYRALHWGILAVGVLTPLMLAGHLVPVATPVRDLIDRLFMLLMLPLFILILRGRKLLLSPVGLMLSPPWLRRAEQLLVILSSALLAGAAIGLIGYINLAWAIAAHAGWFLVILLVWLLLRGLLGDLFGALRSYTARRAEDATWLQNLLGPLRRVAEIALFLLAWWALFRAYGWGVDSPLGRSVRQVLLTPLFKVGERPIHLLGIVLSVLIFVAVLRLGRWSREFTYRWLFIKITNTGARASLSVFTQYLVVLIGFLIALRVLGLDLTTLTVFAGALGLGIGFGLQNVANNFISGILLLIERPVRTGDTVTIGNSEGTVTRIGIRSLTVQTQDSQEVFIPNSEVISHPFTNWTYSDTIVRTALSISINYQNDLHLACGIIEEALHGQPAVLKIPMPEVWLEEFAVPAVTVRIQYFTDLRAANRQEVKSALLFRIWEGFEQSGVRLPGAPPPAAPPPHM